MVLAPLSMASLSANRSPIAQVCPSLYVTLVGSLGSGALWVLCTVGWGKVIYHVHVELFPSGPEAMPAMPPLSGLAAMILDTAVP